MMKPIIVSLFVYFLLSVPFASASPSKPGGINKTPQYGFFYGVFAGYQQEIYRGVDNDIMALPLIGYRGERLDVLGPRISYSFYKDDDLALNTLLQYRFGGYESSDSVIFEGMKDRDASVFAGLGMTFKRNDWTISSSVNTDVLGRSHGTEVNAKLGKTFYFGPIFLEPVLGISYLDNNDTRYYYGVNVSEATALRNVYKPGSALNKRLGLNISTPIFLGGFTRLSLEHTWYDKDISNSPLVDKDTNFGARITFSRFF